MDKKEKEQINELRSQGYGYKKIAQVLDLSVNTVSSYCRRNEIEKYRCAVCKQCGAELKQTPKHRKKKFCSDKCRFTWWNAHPESVSRKAVYHFVCEYCGREFSSYGNSHRKYCSRACYGKSKTKEISKIEV